MKKRKDGISTRSSAAEYLIYAAAVGDQQESVEMRYEDENIWLTQKMMAALYDVDVRTVSDHIKKFLMIRNWKKLNYPEIPDSSAGRFQTG